MIIFVDSVGNGGVLDTASQGGGAFYSTWWRNASPDFSLRVLWSYLLSGASTM
nr:MAG TPA: hypothetical protein [Caudoviricetes sp.]